MSNFAQIELENRRAVAAEIQRDPTNTYKLIAGHVARFGSNSSAGLRAYSFYMGAQEISGNVGMSHGDAYLKTYTYNILRVFYRRKHGGTVSDTTLQNVSNESRDREAARFIASANNGTRWSADVGIELDTRLQQDGRLGLDRHQWPGALTAFGVGRNPFTTGIITNLAQLQN